MAGIQMFDIGASFREGMERGQKRAALRDFFQPAAGGDRNALMRLAQFDPQSAQTAQTLAKGTQESAYDRIGKLAGVYAQTQDPSVWRELRKGLAEAQFPAEMPWEIATDEDRAGSLKFATSIAQQFGGAGAGDSNTVQSRFVGEDGQIYALMRDSTVKPLGIKADPNTQIIEGAGGFYGVDKRTLGATPVQVGQPAIPQRAPGEVPFAIDPSLPPEVQASIRANESQWAQKPEMNIGGDLSHIPPLSTYTGGGQLQAAPKAGPQPSDIERRLALARDMGATPEELKRMVVGGESGRDAQRISTADATKARQKLTQIQSARQQLNAVKQAFSKLRGSFSAGIGGNYLPTPEGQAFDRAIRNLSPLITAVTRVPGVGSMSDYEGRLAEQALPSRGTYESVTEQQIADLERLLNSIEGGYNDLLGKPAAPAVNQGWSIQKLGD